MGVSEHDRSGDPPGDAAKKVAVTDPRAKVKALIDECRARALKIARSLCRAGWPDPEDLVEDIVERVLLKADQLSRFGKGELQVWINKALTHRFIDICRKRTTERNAEEALRALEPEPIRSPEEAYLRAGGKVTPERFQQAVDELKPAQRECLLLHLIHGLKYREIAEKLKTTTGNVGWLISEARRQLRERFLGPDGEKP